MPSTRIEQLVDSYGKLSREVGVMSTQVAAILAHITEDKVISKDYRGDLKDEMAALRMEQAHSNLQMTELKSDVAGVKSDVSSMQSKVMSYEEARLQSLGAGKVVMVLAKMLYAIGGAALVGLGYLVNLFLYGGHSPR